jgi:hypothetical protein
LRLAVARGAAQVLEHGAQAVSRGGAWCASQVLGRGAEADSRGGARYFSQVLGRGAKVVARGAATLPQQEKNSSVMYSRAHQVLPVCSAELPGCASSWLLPTAARR